MKKSTIYKCDICGKDFERNEENPREFLVLSIKRWQLCYQTFSEGEIIEDICPNCDDAICALFLSLKHGK